MKDCFELYKRFEDIKDIKDCINEVNELRHYYDTWQFNRMQDYIRKLTMKYCAETIAWNSVNHCMPTTYQQAYANVESVLQAIGAKLVVEKVADYASRLTKDEFDFIGLMRKGI